VFFNQDSVQFGVNRSTVRTPLRALAGLGDIFCGLWPVVFATVTLSITRCCAWRRTQKLSADCNPSWSEPLQFKFNFVCCVELKVMAGVSLVFGVRASCKHTVVALEKMSNRQAFTAVVADDVV
jgi:hypothetical protein